MKKDVAETVRELARKMDKFEELLKMVRETKYYTEFGFKSFDNFFKSDPDVG